MRNLKRALSLTLASVMLLGMMVVGTSAAGYPDVTEEENIEAIEVLQSVGVMEGDNNGNFNPDDYVTREQMAVIMSKLLNLDYAYYQGTNPFSDVPAWAAPYVAACAANGITSGIGGGMYGAGQNVNAVQAALMMLKALGYFQYQQDFGDDYVLATVKQATEIGLFNQIDSNAQSALTRNEVAQMALNALQADLVRFTGDPGVSYTGSNGESWVGGYKAEYTPRTSTDPKYNRLIDNKHSSNIDYSGQYYCQLGEELYNGDLVKRYDSDIFERPSYTWTYKTELIGTYVDKVKLIASYTSGVKARELYDLLNNITLRDYDMEVYVDGHVAGTGDDSEYSYDCSVEEVKNFDNLVRSNTNNLGITGDGVLTEVYLDRDNEIITVASMHTWLAQATSAYNATRETASLKVYMTSANGTSKTVNVENVPEVEGVAADAFYLVRMSDKDTAKLEVVDINEPQILAESTVTKFTTSNETTSSYPTKLTADGTEYKKSNRAIYDAETLDLYDADLLARSSYNVYLDKYGYFIGVDLFEGEKQYVFVTGYDMRNSNLSIKTAEASAIFLDGTMDTITVNVKDTNDNIKNMVDDKSNTESKEYYKQWGAYLSDGVYLLNRWYTYTVNDAGVYTLKPCVDNEGTPMMLAAKTGNDAGDELKLNCAKLTLNSVDGTGTGNNLLKGEHMAYTTDNLTSRRAYGEDESVFITVDVEDVSAKLNSALEVTKAITDVNGVYTGVQNIDLITERNDRVQGNYYDTYTTPFTVPGSVANDGTGTDHNTTHNWADGYVGENAYAVYDKNHFIIGAVILGEAEGAANTKAYILDPVKYERYENGTYYWQFEAVIDGEIVTQEAQSKYASTIATMRANQYEIVNLRYTDDIVTGVVELDRTDTLANTLGDKIYGNPFGEIKDHQVGEKDTVYDVALTGDEASAWDADKANTSDSKVGFTWVTRARAYTEHSTTGKIFAETELGYLNLQGRSLWVLNGQADYGVDFTRDAKAVVIQPENNKLETRAYATVAEAIDSLSDAIDPTTEVKEFRGIITAALNSQGVAEWIVFFSDTNLDTRNNTTGQVATINVDIHVVLPGASATKWTTVKVPKPATGNLAVISAPVITGYTPIDDEITIVWDRNNDGSTVKFEYTKNGSGSTTTPSDDVFSVRVNYCTDGDKSAVVGQEDVDIPVSKAGFGTLSADLLTDIPDGYKLKTVTAGNILAGTGNAASGKTYVGGEFDKNDSNTKRDVVALVEARTDITAIALNAEGAQKADLKYGTTIVSGAAAELKASGVKFDITFGTTQGKACTITVDADSPFISGIADAATGGTTNATVNGNLTVSASATVKVDVPVEIYALVSALSDFTGTNNLASYVVSSNLTFGASGAKVKKGDTIIITYTAANVGVTTLGADNNTKSAAVTGATPTAVSTTADADGNVIAITEGTADAKAAVVVTIKLASLTGNAVSVATNFNT